MVTVVTGAGGHVGTNLLRGLVEQGREIRAVDMAAPRSDLGDQVTWLRLDVRDQQALTRVYDGADVVFHLAAVISVAGDRGGLVPSVNVDGARSSSRAALAAGVGRFVHCSSIHAFDLHACRGRVIDEQSPRSTGAHLNAYDRSKAAGERAVMEAVAEGLQAVIVNPTGVIGPVDPEPSRMGVVLGAVARGRLPATVQGSFDWVDVRDVAASIMSAAHSGEVGGAHILGGHSASLRELSAIACDAAGSRRPVADLPMWVARLFAPPSTMLARRSHNPLLLTTEALDAVDARPDVSHAKAARLLGHRPRPIEQTVTELVAYLADSGRLR